MLQFLYPLGLLAAIGIIVPVVIHLWNIKSGKTLKIGSISLLGTAANQRSSHLKISDWPLLVLRSLFILLVGCLLSEPLYRKSSKVTAEPGWILLEKQELGRIWDKNKAEMDSLLKKGYEIRDLHVGFAKLELKDTATVFSRPATAPLSYFSLIRQLNAEKQQGATVYLYTANRLNRFEGAVPATSVNLKWRFFPLENRAEQSNAAVRDTSKLLVLIHSNGLTTDAGYLKAAVNAIADFTRRKITIRNIQSLAQVTKEATLVFWLSDKAPDNTQLSRLPAGISFFNYAGTKTDQVKSVLHYETGTATQEIPLYQRKRFDGLTYQAVWTDGSGTPLLTLDSSAIRHYQFYSRFNQSWTDLVWNNAMADALLPLVIPHQDAEFGFDKNADTTRVVNAVPLPTRSTVNTKTAAVFYTNRPLSSYIWWLVAAVFFIERWITYRKTDRKL